MRLLLNLVIVFAVAIPTVAFSQPLSLRIADEVAPPGGVLQAKLEVTEPKPISTGGGHLFLASFEELLGVGVRSQAGDAAAAIVWQRERPTIRVVSPTATLGLEPDYPLLTLTMRVPVQTAIGSHLPLRFAGGIQFLDPSSMPYAYEFRDGEAVISEVPSITNVTPGSAALPAGAIVMIEGTGFTPDLEVRFHETSLASVTVLSSTLIRVVLAQPTVMHGKGIQIRSRSPESRSTYYSYQRTSRLGTSTHPLFAAVEAAFPQSQTTDASVAFAAAAGSLISGIAVQNLADAATTAVLELQAPGRRQQAALTLPPNTRAVRTLEELFGRGCEGLACSVRVSASIPLQVIGLVGNVSEQSATPILPGSALERVRVSTQANASTYRRGELLTLHAMYESAAATLADVYVVLQTPAGEFLSLTPAGLVTGLVPFRRNMPVTTFTEEILRANIPPGTATGSYRWLSALATPGTLDLLTPIASTAFAVQP